MIAFSKNSRKILGMNVVICSSSAPTIFAAPSVWLTTSFGAKNFFERPTCLSQSHCKNKKAWMSWKISNWSTLPDSWWNPIRGFGGEGILVVMERKRISQIPGSKRNGSLVTVNDIKITCTWVDGLFPFGCFRISLFLRKEWNFSSFFKSYAFKEYPT